MTQVDVNLNVDDFLEEHRKKLFEDRKILNDILNLLEEKQQALAQDIGNSSQNTNFSEFDRKPSNREEEISFKFLDISKDEHPRVMVRYGEFSPLNPEFRSSSKPLLGLGEYEERRKIFLEKKKREYQQYLSKVKSEKEREKIKSTNKKYENRDALTNIVQSNGTKISPKAAAMSREIFSPGRGVVEATDPCYARWQQLVYRKELDRQILEKKKRLQEEKEQERRECEKKQKEMMMEQMKLSKSIAEQIRRYQLEEMSKDRSINEKENQIHVEEINLPDFSSAPVCSLGFNPVPKILESPPNRLNSSIFSVTPSQKSSENMPNRTNSPIFNITPNRSRKSPDHKDVLTIGNENKFSPIPSVSNIEVDSSSTPRSPAMPKTVEHNYNSKSQQEMYKNELARQIEEKKLMEMERKRREMEEEKKIEEKVKLEEEKLRLEYEKEQAERAYRASQRVQQEVRLQEHLRKLQKDAEDRKKNTRQANTFITPPKQSVYPTDHGGTSKGGLKNVSFAPKACVYSIQNTKNYVQANEVTSTKNEERDPSQIIVEAPYVLAVTSNEINNNDSDFQDEVTKKEISTRPRSPPIPAIKTKNLLKSFYPTEDMIPSTVSMSKEAKEKFLKDSKIISNLSEIRRKLLLKQAGQESK